MGTIKDADIFEQYEKLDRQNFQSALLTGHLATHLLAEQGILTLTGAHAVFEGPVNYAYAYAMTKSSTHALALNLAQLNELPESASVITILPQIIDTPDNRKGMPDADHATWTPPDGVADLVHDWAEGKNRPLNGSFARLDYEQGSVFPTFL